MNTNSIGSMSPSISGSSFDVKENPQFKTLEHKLSQLNREKEKAEKAKDADKVRELQQKIREIERQLEQLRKKETKQKEETGQDLPLSGSRLPKGDTGNYVDESV